MATFGAFEIAALSRYLKRCRGRQDVFNVDPLGGVVAGVAGHAEAIALASVASLEQAFEREVRKRIRLDELANLFDGFVGGDQVALTGRVHAVETRRGCGRATDAQMYFFGAGAAD